MLRKSEILRAIDSSAPPQNDNQAIALPSGAGLCYSGMGIMFEVDGQRYPMTETNRQTLEEAPSSKVAPPPPLSRSAISTPKPGSSPTSRSP